MHHNFKKMDKIFMGKHEDCEPNEIMQASDQPGETTQKQWRRTVRIIKYETCTFVSWSL